MNNAAAIPQMVHNSGLEGAKRKPGPPFIMGLIVALIRNVMPRRWMAK